MSQFTDIFWPTLEAATVDEAAEDRESENNDIAAARELRWKPSEGLAVEEARRLADAEEERRRATEGKASTYLLFASAFAAALIPFLPGILEGKTGAAPSWVIAVILILAALYLGAAGVWAFRTLRVGVYHRLDVADLARIWRKADPRRALVQETMAFARMNYRAVNEKVSCIKMAHAFMVRSFVVFAVLIVVEAGWEAVSSLIRAGSSHASVETHESVKGERPGAAAPAAGDLKPQTERGTDESAQGPSGAKSSSSPNMLIDNSQQESHEKPPSTSGPTTPPEGPSKM